MYLCHVLCKCGKETLRQMQSSVSWLWIVQFRSSNCQIIPFANFRVMPTNCGGRNWQFLSRTEVITDNLIYYWNHILIRQQSLVEMEVRWYAQIKDLKIYVGGSQIFNCPQKKCVTTLGRGTPKSECHASSMFQPHLVSKKGAPYLEQ
jgi:hypothetical protein